MCLHNHTDYAVQAKVIKQHNMAVSVNRKSVHAEVTKQAFIRFKKVLQLCSSHSEVDVICSIFLSLTIFLALYGAYDL